mgnify:CR=1 FL=1|jgi:S1-C subfamily serine protease
MSDEVNPDAQNISGSTPEGKNYEINWSLWVPPLLLAFLLLVVLIYLLVPGNLIYPTTNTIGETVKLDDRTNQQLKENLRKRASELEMLLSKGQCTAEGLAMPDGGFSLLPPTNNTQENRNNRSALLPPPNQLSSSEPNTSLSDFLTKSVVFIALDDGFGTGFFIDENKILTNRHVVENAKGIVKVFSPNSVKSFDASVIGLSEDFSQSNEDFAILLSSETSQYFLKFAAKQKDLSLLPVISAGYPGDVLDTIMELDQDGDGILDDGIPLFLTSGVINAVQKFKDKGATLFHSADISQGNSGGPLVNACGEVLGINTFTRSDQVRTLNIALSADGLEAFLKKSDVMMNRMQAECRPEILPLSSNP